MAKIFNRALQITGETRVIGTPSVEVLEYDGNGMAMRAKGTAVPTDADAGYAKGCTFIDTNASASSVYYVNEGSASSCDFNVAVGETAATAYDDIGNPDASGSITMAGYTGTYTSSTANWGGIILENSATTATSGATLLSLKYKDDGEANGIFLKCIDHAGADTKFTVGADGNVIIAGTASGTDALTLTAGDITVTAGDVTMTDGDLLLTAGNLTMTVGDLSMVDGDLTLDADDAKIGIGAAGTTDSYITFDGTSMKLYDTEIGTAKSLLELFTGTQLNPTVNGNLAISDGTFNWTDATDETAATWTFSQTGAGSDIDIVSSMTTGEGIHVVADDLTTGNVIHLETDGIGATGAMLYLDVTVAGHTAGGNFIECYNGAADVFEVGKYGAVTIAGNATGTDALTLTAGDITVTSGDCTLTDGDYVITEGKITVATVIDETTSVARNKTGSTSAVVEIEATHTGDTGSALLIDHKGTGNAIALEITHAGDYATIDISASAAREGNVIDIDMANQLAETALDIHGACTGTNAEGIIHVDVTGVLAGNAIRVDSTGANAATGSLIYATSSGKQAGATAGVCASFTDTGAATATSYTVYISSTSNEALHVDAGEVLIDEYCTATLGHVTAYTEAVDLTATPTNADFDSAFGATQLSKAGWMGIAKDSGGTPVYFVTSDGTDWWYVALTKAL